MFEWLTRSPKRASRQIAQWQPDKSPPETCVRQVRQYFSQAEPTEPMIAAGVSVLLAGHKPAMTESEHILLAARINRAMEAAR